MIVSICDLCSKSQVFGVHPSPEVMQGDIDRFVKACTLDGKEGEAELIMHTSYLIDHPDMDHGPYSVCPECQLLLGIRIEVPSGPPQATISMDDVPGKGN